MSYKTEVYEHAKQINSYVVWNNNEDIIRKSSSAGAFSAFAETILLDGGVVYGAAFDSNNEVIIKRIDSVKDLHELRGSKYVQAKLKDTLSSVNYDLGIGKIVLFSGTPCQVAALRNYLQVVGNTNKGNLFCIDIICHGTPHPKTLRNYLIYLEKKYSNTVDKCFFRYKKYNEQAVFRVEFNNGTVFEEPFHPKKNIYADIFYSNISLTKQCVECKFNNLNRPGDVTVGDFWGIENTGLKKHKMGNSLVLLNTDQGRKLFELSKKFFHSEKVNLEEVLRYNPPLYKNSIKNPLRTLFVSTLDMFDINTSYFLFLKLGKFIMLPYRILRKLKKTNKEKI